ncbi:hypothetical protein [Arthrobacter rhombi]|uniref:hypothetical protein n=1 Tax=Arthrobacter rhombi TaxID=71253 RepID=UPI003FD37B4C
MANNPKVKINSAAARKILTSKKVVDDLGERAERIRAACGLDGYMAESKAGNQRARAAVFTGDAEAILDNARNNTLLKNIDRGR